MGWIDGGEDGKGLGRLVGDVGTNEGEGVGRNETVGNALGGLVMVGMPVGRGTGTCEGRWVGLGVGTDMVGVISKVKSPNVKSVKDLIFVSIFWFSVTLNQLSPPISGHRHLFKISNGQLI